VWAFAAAAIVLLLVMLFGERLAGGAGNHGDEGAYIRLAHNLVQGAYAVASQERDGLYLWHPPGLPLVLAPLVALHAPIRVLRLVGPVSLLLAGVFFWLLLRRWVSRWVALAAGLILALFPPFLRLIPHLFSEPLALMFLMAAAWSLANAHRSGSARWAVLSGALTGCMVLTRVEFGWVLLAALLVVAVIAGVRRARADILNLVCAGAAVVVCLPWLGYTASVAHKFPYWASSGGQSLYVMASTTPGNTGSFVNAYEVAHDPRWARDLPLYRRLSKLSQVQEDAGFQHAAFKLIRRHPGVYLEHVADNLGRMVIAAPYTFKPAGRGVYLYGVPTILLLIAVVVALAIMRRRHAPLPPVVRALAVFAALNFVLHLPLTADARMTTLSVPGALAVVAVAAEEAIRARRRASAPTPALAVPA
jgi:4-amino-4-deoxy-L-arabinose transferase-like glycosyltransferase